MQNIEAATDARLGFHNFLTEVPDWGGQLAATQRNRKGSEVGGAYLRQDGGLLLLFQVHVNGTAESEFQAGFDFPSQETVYSAVWEGRKRDVKFWD